MRAGAPESGGISQDTARYMVREERFITDQEAQEWNYKELPQEAARVWAAHTRGSHERR